MKFANVMLMVVAIAIVGVNGGTFEKKDCNKDCDCDATVKSQIALEKHYSDLYKHFIDINSTTVKEDAARGKPGSVIFINALDGFVELECPCKGDVKWEILVDAEGGGGGDEKAHDEAKKEFDDHNYSGDKIKARTPTPRTYFRTYKCTANNGKGHHFNVFTRQSPKTTWPVQWVEGGSLNTAGGREGGGEDEIVITGLEFGCTVNSYKDVKHLFNDTIQFSWVYLGSGSKPQTPGKYRVNVPTTKKEIIHSFKGDKDKDNQFRISYEKGNSDANKSPRAKVVVKGDEAKKGMAGWYECIVVDKYGLSSSFNEQKGKDNGIKCCFDPPKKPYLGYVHIHVRGKVYIFIAIGAIAGGFLLLCLLIFVCPSNKDDMDPAKARNTGKGADTANATTTVAADSPVVSTNLPKADVEPTPAKSITDANGEVPSKGSVGGESKKKKRKKTNSPTE